MAPVLRSSVPVVFQESCQNAHSSRPFRGPAESSQDGARHGWFTSEIGLRRSSDTHTVRLLCVNRR
jgi:hypothetical protein